MSRRLGKVHKSPQKSPARCLTGIRSSATAALHCSGETSPSCRNTDCCFFLLLSFSSVTSRLKAGSSGCKIHSRQTEGFFQLGAACHGGGGPGRDEELNAVYAHDPALIPEQARTNMAACTTTQRGGGEREEVRRRSVLLGYFRTAAVVDRSSSQ